MSSPRRTLKDWHAFSRPLFPSYQLRPTEAKIVFFPVYWDLPINWFLRFFFDELVQHRSLTRLLVTFDFELKFEKIFVIENRLPAIDDAENSQNRLRYPFVSNL